MLKILIKMFILLILRKNKTYHLQQQIQNLQPIYFQ